MLRTLALAAALAAFAPAAAQATPPAYWGGGGVPDRVPEENTAAYLGSWGVGLRRSEDGRRMDVRVAFAVRACGRHPANGADAVVTADLAADGTFHLRRAPARTDELGKVYVTIDGTAVAGRADGTVSVRTAWGCGMSRRAFTARQVDPDVLPSGATPAPADGMLYGITFQDLGRAPHPLVVKVEDGATVAHAFMTWTQHCTGRLEQRPFTADVVYQEVLAERPVGTGGWQYARDQRDSAADRAMGLHFHNTLRFNGLFDGPVLRGLFQNTQTYRRGKNREACSSRGAQGFAAMPA